MAKRTNKNQKHLFNSLQQIFKAKSASPAKSPKPDPSDRNSATTQTSQIHRSSTSYTEFAQDGAASDSALKTGPSNSQAKGQTHSASDSRFPDVKSLEKEAARVRYKKRFGKTLLSTVGVLIVVAAISILVATLWLPVLRIYGNSMNPTLNEGNIVASVKAGSFQPGDIIAFYYNNKILIKRVIAGPGDWVDLSEDGTVYVNGQELIEPYIEEKSRGETNIEYPYQVPEDRWFVMGDHRDVSLDSRTKAIGPVAEEQIVGKLVYKLWPMNEMKGL